MLNLHKPICFFDLETTGINVGKDRIVEISVLKVFPNEIKKVKRLELILEFLFLKSQLIFMAFQMKMLLTNLLSRKSLHRFGK